MAEVGVSEAARNNARWCDAVCGAHGSPGRFHASHWIHAAPAPPRYPNLVTLSPSFDSAAVSSALRGGAAPASVKDSFRRLRLEGEGFRVLFEAEWILRPAALAPVRRETGGARCVRVGSEAALAAWEAAWGESRGAARVFLPALLGRVELAILGIVEPGGALAAGAIAHRTDGVVGFSNFFACAPAREALRRACVEAAHAAFPGLPLVGYESGRDLEEARSLGFRSIGALRVWTGPEPAGRPRAPLDAR